MPGQSTGMTPPDAQLPIRLAETLVSVGRDMCTPVPGASATNVIASVNVNFQEVISLDI